MTTRRAFATGLASLALPAPTPVAAEDVDARVVRLGRELSAALDGFYDGKFGAEIMPASMGRKTALLIFDIETRTETQALLTPPPDSYERMLWFFTRFCEAAKEVDPTITRFRTSYDIETGVPANVIARHCAPELDPWDGPLLADDAGRPS
ncbi:MAG: hypothetical protein JNK84_17860 [Phreatobacter sp.]|uniref:hypothetical protein n=1 Tax=Phreatobacter sp. TaxID=1966341 RepID=UPI001A406326|nr:hypothetical protein [Phreatobacter sp.]MBL8570939.1 hypothetical protein [Phreatobacter sp.]